MKYSQKTARQNPLWTKRLIMSVKSTVGQNFYLYISLYIIFVYHSLCFTLFHFLSASSCFFTLSHSFYAFFFSVCFCLRLFHNIFLYILLYLSLSLCLSQSHSLCLTQSLFIYIYLSLHFTLSISVSLKLSFCMSHSLNPFLSLFLSLSFTVSFFLCLFLSLATNIPSLFPVLLPTPKMYWWFNCVMVIQSRPFLLSESSFILWTNLRQSGLLSGFLVLESRFYCKMI